MLAPIGTIVVPVMLAKGWTVGDMAVTQSFRVIAVSTLALALAGCGGGGSGSTASEGGSLAPAPSPNPAPAPSPTPTPTPPPPQGSRTLGINLSNPAYWAQERGFMNLAMGGLWMLVETNQGWKDMPASRIARDGSIVSLGPNEDAALVLQPPEPSSSGSLFRCTYDGTGKLLVGGSATAIQQGDQSVQFRWTYSYPATDLQVWIQLTETNAGDPLRNIDCREATASPTQLFSKEFVESIRPFGVIRFLDWQNTNANQGGVWDQRTLPNSFQIGVDGVAVEHMVALVNELNSDAWFLMPYFADENYIRRFAQYVHDNMPANRTVYVEVGNEIWNSLFPVAGSAQQEGIAMNLDSDPFIARMKRYAQKTNAAMRIWTEVFADRPSKLVRVIGSQAASPWLAEQLLTWSDPALVDAVAIAPYFGYDLFKDGARVSSPMSERMLWLASDADSWIERAKTTKGVTTRFGKRLLAYEAGQHIVDASNQSPANAVQRDAGMYDVYKRYIDRWHNEVSDLMMLFNSTGPLSHWGSWGLREYNGQPLSETPKRRAALDAANAQIAAQGN